MVFLVIINGKTTNESSRQIKFRCQSTISVDPLKRHLNVKSMTTVSRRQSEPQIRKEYFMNTILKFGSVALALPNQEEAGPLIVYDDVAMMLI